MVYSFTLVGCWIPGSMLGSALNAVRGQTPPILPCRWQLNATCKRVDVGIGEQIAKVQLKALPGHDMMR
jgi:hypothetical protein